MKKVQARLSIITIIILFCRGEKKNIKSLLLLFWSVHNTSKFCNYFQVMMTHWTHPFSSYILTRVHILIVNAFESNFYFISLAAKTITWPIAGYLIGNRLTPNLLVFFTSYQKNSLNVAKKYKHTYTHSLKSQSWKIKPHPGHTLCNRHFQLACALVITDSSIRVSGRGLGLLIYCAEPISSRLGLAARPVSTGTYNTISECWICECHFMGRKGVSTGNQAQ